MSKHENFAAHFNPFHGTQFGKPCLNQIKQEMINIRDEKEKRKYNNNIIKQIERLNNQSMTSLRNDDGWHSLPRWKFSSTEQGE